LRLDLTEDQQFFRETTGRFIASTSPREVVRELHHTPDGFDRGRWRQAAELGWATMLVPEDHGGGSVSGEPLADAVIVAEEMGAQLTPGPFLPANVVASALADAGTHEESLRRVMNGESIAAWALAEPGDTWRLDAMTTTATADGEDDVHDGTKAYVEAAASADLLLVTARTEGGVTQVLVPADCDGVSVRPSQSIDLGRHFGTVHLADVRLPRTAVVGEIGRAEPHVERQFQIALALQCADIVGGLGRVFDFTLEYMNDRYAFGRPISSYQALKHRVADVLLMLETARACCDAAVAAFDGGGADAATEASVAKAYVADAAMHIIQECMQFHGGISVTWEHDLHLYLRRASVSRALFGTPEFHRNRICTLLGF
jgi:alkylation response protein AidB-like acyl-CoA dehydrogenase